MCKSDARPRFVLAIRPVQGRCLGSACHAPKPNTAPAILFRSYAQHSPLLSETLDLLAKGKLREAQFPSVTGGGGGRPSTVIVFMVGGATYAEAAKVAEFNAGNDAGMHVLLGGTSMQNSKSFLGELRKGFSAFARERRGSGGLGAVVSDDRGAGAGFGRI